MWVKCLAEAAAIKMPYNFRLLFATILTHCEPSEPFKLWIQCKSDLCEDFVYKRRTDNSSTEINKSDENSALLEIENFLNQIFHQCHCQIFLK